MKCEEKKQTLEPDLDMTHMLKLTDIKYKMSFNKLKVPVEKVDNMEY